MQNKPQTYRMLTHLTKNQRQKQRRNRNAYTQNNNLQRSHRNLSNSPIKNRSDTFKRFRKYARRRLRANNEYVAPNSSNSSLDGVLKSVSSKKH
jgi:hypothetical protein